MVCATRSRGFLGKSSQAWGVGSSQQTRQAGPFVFLTDLTSCMQQHTENQGWVTVFISAVPHFFSYQSQQLSAFDFSILGGSPFCTAEILDGDFVDVYYGDVMGGGPNRKGKSTYLGTLSNLFFPVFAYDISVRPRESRPVVCWGAAPVSALSPASRPMRISVNQTTETGPSRPVSACLQNIPARRALARDLRCIVSAVPRSSSDRTIHVSPTRRGERRTETVDATPEATENPRRRWLPSKVRAATRRRPRRSTAPPR